ncbi:MAG: carbohydrate-binding protein SusD [Sphingobacteriales bacterium]|nr:carbohydrate-binding protein SusD [Sphingobacteriales bacterium]
MKSKYLIYTAVFALGLQSLSSCKDDFLNVDPKGTILESTYYKTPAQVLAGLVSVYDPMGWETAGSYLNIGGVNSASDDHEAGGGGPRDMGTWQDWNDFTLSGANGPQGDYWSRNFTGVARANTLLQKLETDIAGLDAGTKNRYIAEAKFLRGYYYFDLVRIFKNVPLFTAPVTSQEIYDVTQATPEAVYTQIEKDLNEAIAVLPNTVSAATEGGRATKGAAKALLGKVLLYQKKWAPAAAQLAEVNGIPGGTSQFGYKLLTTYAEIFRPTNKFNSEAIIEIVHSNIVKADWGGWGSFSGNVATTMFGPRGYSGPFYSSGWSFNPITKSLYDVLHFDPRFKATVADIDSLEKNGLATYEKGYANTGWFIQKFAPLTAYKSTAGGVPELNYPQDYIELRLADAYLMEAEALVESGQPGVAGSRAYQLLNAVRSRVGLAPINATLDNIFQERRLELATEGHRFFDLVRTGRAASVLASKGFKAGINEILPIPLGELNNTKLVQNPGYN